MKELLRYDPDSGKFFWLKQIGGRKIGQEANHISHGYILIRVDGRSYRAHRLAFLYMDGQLPELDVDHIDGCKTNNAFVNLRHATRSQNLGNSGVRSVRGLGIKNIQLRPGIKRYSVRVQGKFFGAYEDLELAQLVADEARLKIYGEFANHGTKGN